jgi:cell fate regulator YaaT (PSP1 superfamily)
MFAVHDYLVSYGCAGDFGRFHPVKPFACRRGDRAVIRTTRGLELGSVLCPTAPGHAQFLPNTTVGHLLRIAGPDDIEAARGMQARGEDVFAEGRGLAAELGLPLEILDAEVLLDGQRAVVYFVRWAACDMRSFVSGLSRQHAMQIELHDVSRVEQGCGKPNCGRSKGGCDSCGEGGCGSCGSQDSGDFQAYFAELREQMIAKSRTPLL